MTSHFVSIIDDQGKLMSIFGFDESDRRYEGMQGKSLGASAMTKEYKRELLAAYAEALVDRKRRVCRYQCEIDNGRAIIENQIIRFPDYTATALVLSRVFPVGQKVQLSIREREVLQLSAKDQSDQQIAAALKIARGTVSRHKQNIRQKIGVHEWSSAMLWAQANGLL